MPEAAAPSAVPAPEGVTAPAEGLAPADLLPPAAEPVAAGEATEEASADAAPRQSLNPLASLDLENLSATRELPLFTPTRSPPPPPAPPPPPPEPVVAAPPPPVPPTPPALQLVGILMAGSEEVALLVDPATNAMHRLRSGDLYDGWSLEIFDARTVEFMRDGQSYMLRMFDEFAPAPAYAQFPQGFPPPFGNVQFGAPQPFGQQAPQQPQQPITTFDWPEVEDTVPQQGQPIPESPPIGALPPPSEVKMEPPPPMPVAPPAAAPVIGPEVALPEVGPPADAPAASPNDLATEAPPLPIEPEL
jgi:general secretion pathway protein N